MCTGERNKNAVESVCKGARSSGLDTLIETFEDLHSHKEIKKKKAEKDDNEYFGNGSM